MTKRKEEESITYYFPKKKVKTYEVAAKIIKKARLNVMKSKLNKINESYNEIRDLFEYIMDDKEEIVKEILKSKPEIINTTFNYKVYNNNSDEVYTIFGKLEKRLGENQKIELKKIYSNITNEKANDSEGITPLYLAARLGQKKIVELLIEKGAEVNARTQEGHTPLMVAVLADNIEIAEIILDAYLESRKTADKEGFYALNYAVKNKNFELVKLLFFPELDIQQTLKSANNLPKPNTFELSEIINWLENKLNNNSIKTMGDMHEVDYSD